MNCSNWIGGKRAAKIVALINKTPAVCQKVFLFAGFDTFGDDFEPETVAQCDDCACNRRVIVIGARTSLINDRSILSGSHGQQPDRRKR